VSLQGRQLSEDEFALIREAPGARIVGRVRTGDDVTIVGQSGDFYEMRWERQREVKTAYISKSAVVTGADSAAPETEGLRGAVGTTGK
jgi:hypothetical protein